MKWLLVFLIGCATATVQGPHVEPPVGAEAKPTAEMRIHLIDVGQGAATLIEFSCGVVLVDTGGEQNGMFDSNKRLTEYLDRFFKQHKRFNSTINLLVLTHPHIDHTRAAMIVYNRYHVLNVVTDGLREGSGGETQSALIGVAKAQVQVHASDIPAKGLRDAVIDPLSCPDGDPDIRAFGGDDSSVNANNDSVVMRFTLGQARFLITGDMEREGIADLLAKNGPELHADVWQVGHHGSWNATTKELLDAIQPKLALIGMGRVERQDTWSAWAYGHPRIESIELLEKALTGPKRDPIEVSVGHGARDFAARTITAPIYATGWDGDVLVTLHADGRATVRFHHSAGNATAVAP
ncbi:MAG: MBL fold metallo-hydrolase [Kofleriaceae bacterium]